MAAKLTLGAVQQFIDEPIALMLTKIIDRRSILSNFRTSIHLIIINDDVND